MSIKEGVIKAYTAADQLRDRVFGLKDESDGWVVPRDVHPVIGVWYAAFFLMVILFFVIDGWFLRMGVFLLWASLNFCFFRCKVRL